MSSIIRKPLTYQQHPSLGALHYLLQQMFSEPEPMEIPDAVVGILRQHCPRLSEFPRIVGTYSRTILYRHENGYEAMAARWDKGTLTTIHGHPSFLLYYVIEGELKVDNYIRTETGLITGDTMVFRDGEGFYAIGESGRFDNSIHQVQANEETFSLHIFSDDGTKGEVFDSRNVRTRKTGDPDHASSEVSAGKLESRCGSMALLSTK